ncbi:MAG: TfoX/Sxy family protein [Pedobacter sp.]|nr:TfoX/Sxy family protein [Pedobacter sp.]
MASEQKFVDFIIDQINFSAHITNKKMFGEYGLYFDNKLFGLVCDNKLFIKPTQSGRAFINHVVEASPYPGAKPSFLIEEKLDDRQWLRKLIEITVNELPEPKLKKINRIRKIEKS